MCLPLPNRLSNDLFVQENDVGNRLFIHWGSQGNIK